MPEDAAPHDPVMQAAIEELLACPCGGALVPEPEHARCESCGRRHPIRDGVLDFLAEEPGETSSGKESG